MSDTSHIGPTLDELRERARRLRAEAEKAEEALDAAEIAAAPFHVGDEVLASRRRDQWEPAIVRRVRMCGQTYWYHVSWRKRNGD